MAGTRLEREGPPTGLKRLLFRAPIPLYRARLGFLFGERFLMLEHTGRKSGETRRTILEVVVNDPDAAYVAAAWGHRAQWLRNVEESPNVTFHLGSRTYQTEAEVVAPERARGLMERYATQHPKVLDRLASYMLDDPGETPVEQAKQVAERVPMVRLSKQGG